MTGIIVLCRINSTRLPGKILMKIQGKTILEYIIERLGMIEEDIDVVICTSVEKTDDGIIELCQEKNWNFYRGSLNNVADRFMSCATEYGFSNAIRINGDNLFVDSGLITKILEEHHQGQYEFSSNVKERTFPKGMSVEIVNMDYYREEYPKFNKQDLEHVMSFFYRKDENTHKHHFNTIDYGETLNFAIDTQEDFEKAKKVIERMKADHLKYDMQEIIKLYKSVDEEK